MQMRDDFLQPLLPGVGLRDQVLRDVIVGPGGPPRRDVPRQGRLDEHGHGQGRVFRRGAEAPEAQDVIRTLSAPAYFELEVFLRVVDLARRWSDSILDPESDEMRWGGIRRIRGASGTPGQP